MISAGCSTPAAISVMHLIGRASLVNIFASRCLDHRLGVGFMIQALLEYQGNINLWTIWKFDFQNTFFQQLFGSTSVSSVSKGAQVERIACP
jgi:hypothetical protein